MHVYPAAPGQKLRFMGKPLQNWIHPLIGVIILAVGWITTYQGFDEWATWAGLGSVPKGVVIAWGILLGVFLVAYLGGLALLPRQFRQQNQSAGSYVKRQSNESISLRERGGTRSNPSTMDGGETGVAR
jgi:hypothetical protein